MNERSYTVTEAAERLHVSRFTVIKWVKAGRMLGYRVGPKVIRIPASEVERMEVPFCDPIEAE